MVTVGQWDQSQNTDSFFLKTKILQPKQFDAVQAVDTCVWQNHFESAKKAEPTSHSTIIPNLKADIKEWGTLSQLKKLADQLLKKKQTVPLTTISFNQADLIVRLNANQHKTLIGFVDRFDGLCELICNRILIDDLLGKGRHADSIKNRVHIIDINEDEIKKSHLLDIYSLFHKALAFLFGIYPDNIFSITDQWKLIRKVSQGNARKVNREILSRALADIPADETLKLEVFSKNGLSFSGHSLLIKKMSKDDTYIFFDPNSGEHRDLSFEQLSDKIDDQLAFCKGTDIYLHKASDYLKRLNKK